MLTEDRYTMGKKVEEFEKKFSEYSGMYALGLSSGSTANHLVFELWKIKNPGKKALVIVPAVTWISSISPIIMAGLDIEFCDINLTDFSFDYRMLEKLLINNAGRPLIIWPTALIGFTPNMNRINDLASKYGAEVFMDSCENTFGTYDRESILSTCPITTTSCYFSHQIVAIEFGFAFFLNKDDYALAKMFRNHGLTRSLSPDDELRKWIEKDNFEVDKNFLFALNGTNFRPTDVHAMFGLQDFKRIAEYTEHRKKIYRYFYDRLRSKGYYLPPIQNDHVGFCLPLFVESNEIDALKNLKEKLTANGIEVRPIISGNLLRQPPFKKYGKPEDFPNAEWVHYHGCYIGLHKNVTEKDIDELTQLL